MIAWNISFVERDTIYMSPSIAFGIHSSRSLLLLSLHCQSYYQDMKMSLIICGRNVIPTDNLERLLVPKLDEG